MDSHAGRPTKCRRVVQHVPGTSAVGNLLGSVVLLLELALVLLLDFPRNLHWVLLEDCRARGAEHRCSTGEQHAGVGVQRVHLYQRGVESRVRGVQHCLCSSSIIELQRQRWQQRRARGSWGD